MTTRTASEPLKTRRIYLLLKDRIVSGGLKRGDKLPSEFALAQEFEVSRITVRQALDLLVSEGLVQKRPGSGTFVLDVKTQVRAVIKDVSNLFSSLMEMGRRTSVALLAFDYLDPAPEVSAALDLDSDERVQRTVRVRSLDGEPFSYLIAQIPERWGRQFSRADLEITPLLALLEASGLRAASARQEISAVLASPDVAAALGVEVGAALLKITRVVRDANDTGFEHLQAFYRPDRFAFQMDLIRVSDSDGIQWGHAAPR